MAKEYVTEQLSETLPSLNLDNEQSTQEAFSALSQKYSPDQIRDAIYQLHANDHQSAEAKLSLERTYALTFLKEEGIQVSKGKIINSIGDIAIAVSISVILMHFSDMFLFDLRETLPFLDHVGNAFHSFNLMFLGVVASIKTLESVDQLGEKIGNPEGLLLLLDTLKKYMPYFLITMLLISQIDVEVTRKFLTMGTGDLADLPVAFASIVASAAIYEKLAKHSAFSDLLS